MDKRCYTLYSVQKGQQGWLFDFRLEGSFAFVSAKADSTELEADLFRLWDARLLLKLKGGNDGIYTITDLIAVTGVLP